MPEGQARLRVYVDRSPFPIIGCQRSQTGLTRRSRPAERGGREDQAFTSATYGLRLPAGDHPGAERGIRGGLLEGRVGMTAESSQNATRAGGRNTKAGVRLRTDVAEGTVTGDYLQWASARMSSSPSVPNSSTTIIFEDGKYQTTWL
ncbi:hypothetical protein GCM10023075_82480 [Streptosporangium album]